MYLETIKKINETEIKEFNQSRVKSPLSVSELNRFIKESQLIFNYTPCDEYVNFLRLTNGFEWDGMVFYNAEDFLFGNIESRRISDDYKKFIVFGGSGNVDTYTYNIDDKTFNISDTFEFDDDFESFDTFGDLVDGVFNEYIK